MFTGVVVILVSPWRPCPTPLPHPTPAITTTWRAPRAAAMAIPTAWWVIFGTGQFLRFSGILAQQPRLSSSDFSLSLPFRRTGPAAVVTFHSFLHHSIPPPYVSRFGSVEPPRFPYTVNMNHKSAEVKSISGNFFRSVRCEEKRVLSC